MLFKKSQTIPFEILKILRLSPTHGYNIFLNLKRQGLVKDPSELYKMLRSMEQENFIAGVEQKSEHGPKRKIYSLTPAGFGEFYTAVVDSAKLFLNLLIEATFSQMGDQVPGCPFTSRD